MENEIEVESDPAEVEYINTYLDCLENLPNDLQIQLSRILDLDVLTQKFLRTFFKQQQYVIRLDVDKTVREQAFAQIHKMLISLQNIGDEKLQLVQKIQNIVEKTVELLNVQRKNLTIDEQENNEPSNRSNNLNSSNVGKNTKFNLRGRKSKQSGSEKLSNDTSILSENQSNISSTSTGTSKKTNLTNSSKRPKRKTHTNQKYEEDNVSEDDPDEPIYCTCRQISFGKMIMCDNDACTIEWFHFKCVALTKKPKGKWYCPHCRGHRPNIMKPKVAVK